MFQHGQTILGYVLFHTFSSFSEYSESPSLELPSSLFLGEELFEDDELEFADVLCPANKESQGGSAPQ